MAPVMAGMWKQHETWDGTYTFEDLLDAREMLEVQAENRVRMDEFRRANQEGGG